MSLPVGTLLGPYEILAPIGAGGMGEVYRARDTRLERDVAIKVLPDHLARAPAALSRFEREAKTVASMSHPNIVALFDVGSEQGLSFVVTELLEGETLQKRLAARAMRWPDAVAIASAVLDGLAAAHGKGIIHRDIKPANIFLTADGGVKVLDFGLARTKAIAAAADPASSPTETQAGVVMGTVGYMSPEQVRGEQADVPSDIFSFGCVLYEMLAGSRPFARGTSVQTMAAILEAHPPDLAASGQIPVELGRIVERCLEKNPQLRYQSARDAASALHAMSPAAAPSRAAKSRFHPRYLAVALAVIAIAAASLYLLNRRPNATVESVAVLPFANVGSDPAKEYLSDGIAENLTNSLSQLPGLRVVARTLAFRYRGSQVDAQKAGRELRVRAVITGRVTDRDGMLNVQAELMEVASGAQLWGGQYSRSMSEILAVQQEVVHAISAKLGMKATVESEKRVAARSTENTEAYQLYLRGRYLWNRRNEQALKRAVEYFQQAIDKDPGYALAYAGLADCYAVYNSYQVEPPRESAPKAKAAARKALEIDKTLAQAHASLGMIHMSYEWDWAAAEREFRRAIDLDPNYATAHHWYAICLASAGRSDEALAELKRAQELDPLSLIINADMGLILHFGRRDDEAVAQLRKGLDMDPNFAAGHRPLGMAYEQKGMHKEALAELQRALAVSQGNPFALGALGHAQAVSGQRQAALRAISDLVELSKRRYVPPFDVAVIHAGLGDTRQALEWLERAFDDRSLEMIFLKVDPRFDRLHSQPRFTDLLHRMGLS